MSTGTLPGLLAGVAVLAVAGTGRSLLRPPIVTGPPPRTVVVHRDPRGGRRPTRRARARRRAAADAQVPELLDLLAAGSSAGLSAELALRRASEVLPGALGEELRAVFADADLGGRWRAGLAELATTSRSADLRRTVVVLERTETLGSSLVEATRELARAVRRSRRADTLERARTAPVKMLFPLVFLILPAFLLLTVVPVLLTTVRSIG
jgi:tight adherence protein C